MLKHIKHSISVSFRLVSLFLNVSHLFLSCFVGTRQEHVFFSQIEFIVFRVLCSTVCPLKMSCLTFILQWRVIPSSVIRQYLFFHHQFGHSITLSFRIMVIRQKVVNKIRICCRFVVACLFLLCFLFMYSLVAVSEMLNGKCAIVVQTGTSRF